LLVKQHRKEVHAVMRGRSTWTKAQIMRQLPLIAIAGMCALLGVSAWFLPTATLPLIIGGVALASALYSWPTRLDTPVREPLSVLELPFRLAQDGEIFTRHQALTELLWQTSRRADPIFRQLALEQLDEVVARTRGTAAGTFVYSGTETWRMVYEHLLRSPGLYRYRSVAWVQNPLYWQDEPGRKSLAVNFELAASGQLEIERVVIIQDELWPSREVWPVAPLRQWLAEQHHYGIRLFCVRASALAQEADLIGDIGIYGVRALGRQELDEQCRTVHFSLTFDDAELAAAEERWRRLIIYAESWSRYLDRFDLPG
jgi:hypothetical protein